MWLRRAFSSANKWSQMLHWCWRGRWVRTMCFSTLISEANSCCNARIRISRCSCLLCWLSRALVANTTSHGPQDGCDRWWTRAAQPMPSSCQQTSHLMTCASFIWSQATAEMENSIALMHKNWRWTPSTCLFRWYILANPFHTYFAIHDVSFSSTWNVEWCRVAFIHFLDYVKWADRLQLQIKCLFLQSEFFQFILQDFSKFSTGVSSSTFEM